MEAITLLAEVLKYVLPALLVLVAVKYMNDTQIKRRLCEIEERRGERC